jgi:hypothetical protein
MTLSGRACQIGASFKHGDKAMAKEAQNTGGQSGIPWRIVGWGTAALLLLLPWVANAPWTASDYVFMAVLFGSVGLAFEFIVRKSGSLAYRFGAGLALLAMFLTIWVNGAVGMIGSEDNPYNLVFGGVLVIALLGAIVARLEPAGMMRAMAVTAVAQVAAGAFGLTADPLGAVFSMGFGALWLLAAALFWNAAREQTSGGAAP